MFSTLRLLPAQRHLHEAEKWEEDVGKREGGVSDDSGDGSGGWWRRWSR